MCFRQAPAPARQCLGTPPVLLLVILCAPLPSAPALYPQEGVHPLREDLTLNHLSCFSQLKASAALFRAMLYHLFLKPRHYFSSFYAQFPWVVLKTFFAGCSLLCHLAHGICIATEVLKLSYFCRQEQFSYVSDSILSSPASGETKQENWAVMRCSTEKSNWHMYPSSSFPGSLSSVLFDILNQITIIFLVKIGCWGKALLRAQSRNHIKQKVY